MKKIPYLAALVAANLCVPLVSHAQVLTVRIGHVAPMSGAQAHFGKDNLNGAQMAIDELNEKGLMIGQKKAKFELVSEDDAADPKQGAAVAQKLCDANVNGVVGHMNSGTTFPAARIYNDCGLPEVTPSATNPALTRNGYKAFYRLMANDNDLGGGLAKLAAGKLKLKRIAVIDDRSAYGQGVAEVFKKTALALGIQIIADEFTTDKATDFSSILTTIKGKSPDAIFYGGNDPQAGPMLRQMAQLGMGKVKFFGGDGICTTKLAELAGSPAAVENVVCAEGGIGLDKTAKGAAWMKRYEAKYPAQFQIYSPYTYDATMVLVEAMKKAGSADPKVYAAQLPNTNYDGVTAKISFESNGELKNPLMTLYRYVNGQKVAMD